MGRSAVGCRAGRLAQPTERVGLREGDGARRRLVRRDRGRPPRSERDYGRGAREVRQAAKAMILRLGEVASDE